MLVALPVVCLESLLSVGDWQSIRLGRLDYCTALTQSRFALETTQATIKTRSFTLEQEIQGILWQKHIRWNIQFKGLTPNACTDSDCRVTRSQDVTLFPHHSASPVVDCGIRFFDFPSQT